MRTPKINTKKLAAALAPLALAGAVMAPTAATARTPASAHAPAATAQAKARATRRFWIHNLTSRDLELTHVGPHPDWPDSGPPLHAVMKPGQEHIYEIPYRVLGNEKVEVSYHAGGNTLVKVLMEVDDFGTPRVIGCGSKDGSVRCVISPKLDEAFLFDNRGTDKNLGPDQKPAQADARNQLAYAKAHPGR